MSCFVFASTVVCCLNVRVGIHIDQLPQLGKTELCFLLPFTCDFVVSVKKSSSSWFMERRGYFILTIPGA